MMKQKKMKEQQEGQMVKPPYAKYRKLHAKNQTTLSKNSQGSNLLHIKKEFLGFLSDQQPLPITRTHSKEEDNMMVNIDYFFDNARKEIGLGAKGS